MGLKDWGLIIFILFLGEVWMWLPWHCSLEVCNFFFDFLKDSISPYISGWPQTHATMSYVCLLQFLERLMGANLPGISSLGVDFQGNTCLRFVNYDKELCTRFYFIGQDSGWIIYICVWTNVDELLYPSIKWSFIVRSAKSMEGLPYDGFNSVPKTVFSIRVLSIEYIKWQR